MLPGIFPVAPELWLLPKAKIDLLSVSIALPYEEILYKGNQAVCSLQCLVSSGQRSVSGSIHAVACVCAAFFFIAH